MKTKIFIFLLLVLLVSCKKSESELPVLRDVTLGKILHTYTPRGSTFALLSSEVINNGGSDVFQQGICYSTSPNPTTDDQISANLTLQEGKFTCNTGILLNTKYYVRAYAKNSNGIGYSNQIEFTAKQYAAPGFTKPTIDSVKNNIVYVSAEVTVNGNPPIIAKGVVIDFYKNFIKAEGKGIGKYTCVLPDLKKDTYIYSYAETEFEIYIGNSSVKYE